MKIGIDARMILNPEKGEAIGVGHYTYQLIRHLLQIDRKNEYVIFFDFRAREKDVRKFTAHKNVKVKFYPFSDYRKYLPGAYNEILGNATLQKEKLDILHSTSPLSRIPLGYSGKCVVTFNNMSLYNCQQCFPTIRSVKERAVYGMMAKRADRIIAVSKSVGFDLQKFLGTSAEKIDIVYSGLDKRFFENPEKAVGKILARFGIEKKYILFLGTLEPSKNITRLLEAFQDFKKENRDFQLVLAGKRGWLSQEYLREIKDFGLQKDVVFTGYVVGDEMVPLFKGAEFFVMPSLYEGFGTTILEAFATGTPVIASDASSIPEIAGDAARLVNPLDVAGLAKAMSELAQDSNLRGKMKREGLAQAKNFDWEKCAGETLEIYKKTVV